MRILIAEDEPALADQISGALRSEGRVVDIAADGENAAHLGATEPYDLVILDLGLPKRDGLSILKEWRAQSLSMPSVMGPVQSMGNFQTKAPSKLSATKAWLGETDKSSQAPPSGAFDTVPSVMILHRFALLSVVDAVVAT